MILTTVIRGNLNWPASMDYYIIVLFRYDIDFVNKLFEFIFNYLNSKVYLLLLHKEIELVEIINLEETSNVPQIIVLSLTLPQIKTEQNTNYSLGRITIIENT